MSLDFDHLRRLHASKRLRLATTVGMQGFVHVDGNPDALVLELIRLAEIGQRTEVLQDPLVRRRAGVAEDHEKAWR